MARATIFYLYWMSPSDFAAAKPLLKGAGLRLAGSLLTPCQVLRVQEGHVNYASPQAWSRLCNRQGSWYRASSRAGKTMLISRVPLPQPLERHLDATLEPTDFLPATLPSEVELESLVSSKEYQNAKPDDWEGIGWKDSLLFKAFFGVMRVWKRGDNLARHWIGQRANHANFLSRRYTTEIDGQEVPYSVTRSKRVCSSCVEFFNLVGQGSRKLVRSCPGAVAFGGAPMDRFLDVRPVAGAR
jgi:hypothetical protein